MVSKKKKLYLKEFLIFLIVIFVRERFLLFWNIMIYFVF